MNDDRTIATLRRAVNAETQGHHAEPGLAHSAWTDAHAGRHRVRTGLAVAASVIVVAGGAAGLALTRDDHSTKAQAGSSACTGNVSNAALPSWASDGFSPSGRHTPHVFSASGDLVAILFVQLRAHQPTGTNNKILWVANGGYGSLRITAKLEGSGTTATRTVDLGPSYVDLPAPGCWAMTVTWSGHTDTIALRYR